MKRSRQSSQKVKSENAPMTGPICLQGQYPKQDYAECPLSISISLLYFGQPWQSEKSVSRKRMSSPEPATQNILSPLSRLSPLSHSDLLRWSEKPVGCERKKRLS